MTVFEMEVFYSYTLFTHIGLYVQEMSIFFFPPPPTRFQFCLFSGWFSSQAVTDYIYRRTPLPRGPDGGLFYSGERWQIYC